MMNTNFDAFYETWYRIELLYSIASPFIHWEVKESFILCDRMDYVVQFATTYNQQKIELAVKKDILLNL